MAEDRNVEGALLEEYPEPTRAPAPLRPVRRVTGHSA
jgi:hypothetical protein